MKKIVVYNFIKEQASIIRYLSKSVNICEWFSYPPHGTADIKEFADVKYRQNNTYGLGETIYEDIYKNDYVKFIDMHQRRFLKNQNTIYDTQRDFNNQFGAIYSLLTEKRPDIILFGNVPHGGHDFLLYRIAKKLGLKTLILFQIPVLPRFMLLESFENFDDLVRNDNNEDLKLPEIKPPVYMNKKNKKRISLKRKVKKIIKKIINIIKNTDNYHYEQIDDTKKNKFQLELKKHDNKIPENSPFIYFPLHLQPEMTTSSLGNEYLDQVLAIERLARKIEPKIKIVVKENPKQTHYQRPRNFYERLKSIKNVVIVSRKINTYELINQSIAVATITGTVGWEAINLNKPVIIFGNTWYEDFDGVFKYNNLYIDDLINYSLNKENLITCFKELLNKSFPGITQSAYFPLIKNIDIEKNNKNISSILLKEINK